jgi:type IV secretory pathway VirB10-like protein
LMVSALNYGMAAMQDKQNGPPAGGTVILPGGNSTGGSSSSSSSSGTTPSTGGGTVIPSNPNVPPTFDGNGNVVITVQPQTQKQQAFSNATSSLSNIAQQLATNYYQVQPRITIDQGIKIKVFVQKDLIFPGRAYNSMNVVD